MGSPEAQAAAELIFGFFPGLGETISARDAYHGFLAALEAIEDDRARDALIAAGLAGLSVLGTVPVLGKLVKLGKGATRAAAVFLQTLRRRAGLGGGKKLRPPAKDVGALGRRGGADPVEGLPEDAGEPAGSLIPGSLEAKLNQQIDDASKQLNFEAVRQIDATEVNNSFPSNWTTLPYKLGTKTIEIRTTDESLDDFVRVHRRENQPSRWIMRKKQLFDSDGRQFTPEELHIRFALPQNAPPPTKVSNVEIPKGTHLRIGAVNSLPDGQGGNVIQYEILTDYDSSWFVNERDVVQ
ncbi:MAG: hypothetical protein MJE12_00420 [Alphaproteobacteria bacterium]|nr:hypothetical protein [Alphaproteobacteria bacterium]